MGAFDSIHMLTDPVTCGEGHVQTPKDRPWVVWCDEEALPQ